jgi:hypothetical protein
MVEKDFIEDHGHDPSQTFGSILEIVFIEQTG